MRRIACLTLLALISVTVGVIQIGSLFYRENADGEHHVHAEQKSSETRKQETATTSSSTASTSSARGQTLCHYLSTGFEYRREPPSFQAIVDLAGPWKQQLPPNAVFAPHHHHQRRQHQQVQQTVEAGSGVLYKSYVSLPESVRRRLFPDGASVLQLDTDDDGALAHWLLSMNTKGNATSRYDVTSVTARPSSMLRLMVVKPYFQLHEWMLLFGGAAPTASLVPSNLSSAVDVVHIILDTDDTDDERRELTRAAWAAANIGLVVLCGHSLALDDCSGTRRLVEDVLQVACTEVTFPLQQRQRNDDVSSSSSGLVHCQKKKQLGASSSTTRFIDRQEEQRPPSIALYDHSRHETSSFSVKRRTKPLLCGPGGLVTSRKIVRDARPSAMALSALVQPTFQDFPYLYQNSSDIFWDLRVLELRKYLPDPETSDVLEVGGGGGQQTFSIMRPCALVKLLSNCRSVRSVTSIEASPLAVAQALTTNTIMNMNHYLPLYGNLVPALDKFNALSSPSDEFGYVGLRLPDRPKVVLAVGVLYHMTEPMRTLHAICNAVALGGKLLLWTHHYEAGHPSMRKLQWDKGSDGQEVVFAGFTHRQHCHMYEPRSSIFLGGLEKKACWLTNSTLFSALERFGLKVLESVSGSDPLYPHVALVAERRRL